MKFRGRGNSKYFRHILANDRPLMLSVCYDRQPGTDFKREMKSLAIMFFKLWTKICRRKHEAKMKTVYFLQNHINIIETFPDITSGCSTRHC